jgi:hypothetical protein
VAQEAEGAQSVVTMKREISGAILSSTFAALFVAFGALSQARAAMVDLSSVVNADLTVYANGSLYPQNGGPLTVGGVGFNLATVSDGHTGVIQGNCGQYGNSCVANSSYLIPVNLFSVSTVYTLMNWRNRIDYRIISVHRRIGGNVYLQLG